MPIVFMDIETAPMRGSFDKLDDRHQELWEKKVHSRNWPEEIPENTWKNALASLAKATEMARRVCALSPEGVAASKQLIHAARQGVPRHAALALERERFVDLFDGPNQKEGVQAFLNKREPSWRA